MSAFRPFGVYLILANGPHARGDGATIRQVSVFKRQSSTHLHIRTPIMLGVVVLLVIVLSAFCYYRVSAPTG